MPKKIIFSEEQAKQIAESLSLKPILPKNRFGNIFSNKSINNADDVLTEGFYRTYPTDIVLKHLCSYLNFCSSYNEFIRNYEKYKGFATIVQADNGEETIQCIIPNDKFSKQLMGRTMGLCGFYEATRDKFADNYDVVVYEKRNQENKINDIVKSKGKIYHITILGKKENILKNGLSPKSNNKLSYHPERIYFYLDNIGEFGFKEMARMLYEPIIKNPEIQVKIKNNKAFRDTITKFVVFSIDTSNLGINFYYDPNMEGAVYTNENIPPKYISILYQF